MSILNTIVEHKKKEVQSCKDLIPLQDLKGMPHFSRQTYSLKAGILDETRSGIIAEFKRKSPSKGVINDTVKVEDVVAGYAANGASAVSVLTDFNFFGGSVDDLQKAREVISIPILRKEFIIDPYQVYEAKAIGADAILLIAAILEKREAENLASLAKDLGLEVLMEIHDETELDKLNAYLDVVGVNNRNLKDFVVDLQHSIELSTRIPDNFVKISESGIASINDIEYLRQYDFKGFLIGENFMKTPDPATALADFLTAMNTTNI